MMGKEAVRHNGVFDVVKCEHYPTIADVPEMIVTTQDLMRKLSFSYVECQNGGMNIHVNLLSS